MVKGNEKDSNSPSSVNKGRSNLGDNAIIQQDLTPNGVVSNNQLELLKLLQHQNHQKQRQQSGNDSDFGHNVTSSSSSSSGGGLMRNLNFAINDNHNASSVSHGEVIDAEVRSHPAYFAYYYSNVNKNPSLPPPLLSLDEWQIFQRFQEVGGGSSSISECRNKDFVEDGMNSQLHQMQRGIALQKAEDDLIEMRKIAARNLSRISSSDMLEGNAIGFASGMGERRKSFADIPQGGFIKSSTPPSRLSRPASYNSLTDVIHRASSTSELENKATSYEASHPGRGLKPPPGFPSRNNRGVPSDREEDVVNSASQSSSHKNSAAEFGLSSFHEQKLQQDYYNLGVSNFMSFNDYINFVMENEVVSGTNLERQMNFPQRASSMVNLQSLANASEYSRLPDTTKCSDQVNNFPKRASSLVNLQSLANSSDPNNQGIKLSNAILEEERLRRRGIRDHYSTNEQHQNQYMEKPDDCVRSTERNAISTSYSADDLHKLGRIYKEAFLSQQKQQDQQQPFLYKPGRMNRQYNGNPASGPVMYKGNQMARSPRSAAGKSGVHLQKEAVSRSSNAFKNKEAVSPVSRTSQGKNVEGKVASGSLQEPKNNKNKSLELSDVLNDVVGYSKDQHGSRFLQQKLETATAEEKTNIFQLVIPHARDLMTDVFGNYVIQKFFESGTESQRRELASQIIGHVLPLSFQMYGCRVIQKALEVIGVEQKTELVRELDGSVMKCVHDQNGNHVIQKSIECVPEDRIQFIVSSFFGQVVALSTHPYGCRVIQRVLEHCNDPLTQSNVMDEILNSVCTLAQDQYGNYVIQHVLQHGKPNERSAIIAKLTGQIVTMSQQKFASNVVEKCLTFAAPEERKVIVNEMLGSTDDNEVLQAMMKDPFGNYVVQKVLETCDDQDRELILARIRVHLNTLKKYTYAKHIVTRVEKLIEAGERQTEMSKKSTS